MIQQSGLRRSLSTLATAAALLLLAATPAAAAPVAAGDAERPTFYRDVAPILQRHCQTCHREGGANYGGMVAPMALLTYEQTRPWAKGMARQVEAGTMPPWGAAPEQDGLFLNERRLSAAEIATLVGWAAAGAPAGDPAAAPPPVVWPDLGGWTIGEPDLVIEIPEPYFVNDDVEDEYVYFRHRLTAEQLPEDRWIRAFEFRPGSSAVHHIILTPIGGIAPGTDAARYREGTGRLLATATELVWQMHYHKEPGPGSGVWDRSRVALKFYPAETSVPFPIRDAMLGNFGFAIPPGSPDYSVSSEHRFSDEARILSFSPHMHLRGKSAIYEALYPDGRRETLLEVPRYDFNWQTTYTYREPRFLPAGTRVQVTTTWDNSAQNPSNPDPTRTVRYGEPTTDEMSFGFVEYIAATPVETVKRDGKGAASAVVDDAGIWRDRELGLAFRVPDTLVASPAAEGLALFVGPGELPQVDIDAEPVPPGLSVEELIALVQEELASWSDTVEVRSVERVTLAGGEGGTEIVVRWSYDGLPLTSLVLAVEHRSRLVTVVVTELEGASEETMRAMARGLRLEHRSQQVSP